MRNTGLEEAQAGIKIAGRNINHLRYADDTTLMAESEELKENSNLPHTSLLLLLTRFIRVQLCATPETAAHKASLSLGFYYLT